MHEHVWVGKPEWCDLCGIDRAVWERPDFQARQQAALASLKTYEDWGIKEA